MTRFAFCLLSILCVAAQQETDKSKVWSDAKLGVSLRLPDASWNLTDQSQGAAKVFIFSPTRTMTTRCTLLVFPEALLPEGLLTRESQLKTAASAAYKRVAYDETKLGGQPAQRLEYTAGGGTTREYGVRRDGAFLILQVASPSAAWDSKEMQSTFEQIIDSLAFTGAVRLEPPGAELSTPDEIRAKRKIAQSPKQDIQLLHHDLQVDIEPAAQSLRVTDRIQVRASKDELARIDLYFSVVKIEEVQGEGLTWNVSPGPNNTQLLDIRWEKPWAAGEERGFVVRASAADFVQSVDQTLIAEISVVGQVRERSSWSSHILYYPIDAVNDATVDLTLIVPQEYTALTGGKLVSKETRDGKASFHYRSDVRKRRILPFGFAVGKYISVAGRSVGGLPLEVYGYPGEEKLLQQRIDLAVECANLFEKMMGKLPFEGVRFAHVTPIAKEMGVSLPGLILISDGYFHDFASADLSNGRPGGPAARSLLVVADELSHQWNLYSASLPNELGEGVSTFTNALVIEQRHGIEGYRKFMQVCADGYLNATITNKDVAVADPAIYQSGAYRSIAFCKVPVVLDMLRSALGDERFFAGWRDVFEKVQAGGDGYELLEKSFTNVTGTDFRWFFDQWLFQPGCPEMRVKFSQEADSLSVTLSQTQQQPAFRVTGELLIRGNDQQSHRRTDTLADRETKLSEKVPFAVQEVLFDPDRRLLTKRAP